MAGFEDVVGYDFVEDGERAGELGGGGAEGVEEGFYWGVVSRRTLGSWMEVASGNARSAVANCWPFWRARMRGSVMLGVE